MSEIVSAACPHPSRFATVKGARMHYLERGQGDAIVLVHGNPTSSYLWRNVIPHLSPLGRCIAPDLIGMGRSDKPAIGYRLSDHVEYFEGFIESLGLQRMRLVLHDWGGFLGLHFAARNPGRVSAIALMETVLKPMRMSDRAEGFQRAFGMLRGPAGRDKIYGENFFVERILPGSILRKLTEEEMSAYREPFLEEASRKPTYVFPNEIPIDGQPADVAAAVAEYDAALAHARIPMLLLTFEPGAIVQEAEIEWCKRNWPRIVIRNMGAGVHFVQEDQPAAIGRALADWFQRWA
ncbi:MAG: haloalkane dehalogenase [SAR324 cluster bacterium]